MYQIIDKRGSGKTSRLMLLAQENNGIFVCANPYGMREKAKNYDLTVKKVKLSYRDLSIKITFQFPNQIGHIDILKTRNKVYLNNVLK